MLFLRVVKRFEITYSFFTSLSFLGWVENSYRFLFYLPLHKSNMKILEIWQILNEECVSLVDKSVSQTSVCNKKLMTLHRCRWKWKNLWNVTYIKRKVAKLTSKSHKFMDIFRAESRIVFASGDISQNKLTLFSLISKIKKI